MTRQSLTSPGSNRASVLFPVVPVQGESLLGYVLRTAEWNHLGRFGAALQALGLSCRYSRHTLSEVANGWSEFREALGIDPVALTIPWGTQPVERGRRRLGGVWLRADLIAASRRRLPPSIRPGQHDQAIWMVKHLGFCPTSWEYLIEVCPRPWCGRPLWWWGAASIDQCWHCGGRLCEVKKTSKVPPPDKPHLRWVVDLFDHREDVVERAISRVPPLFSICDATDVYELIVGLARIFHDMTGLPAQGSARETAKATANAARYILDFPRSHWDLDQGANDAQADFRTRLRCLRDHSSIASVRENAGAILDYWRTRARPNLPEVSDLPYLNLRSTARALQIEASEVNNLAKHGFLDARPTGGGNRRTHWSFRRKQVMALQARMAERLSWAAFCRITGLPQVAIEQLLNAGVLRRCEDGAVQLLYGPHHLEPNTSGSFIKQLLDAALPNLPPGWIALRDVMIGVGGRAKPWQPILSAALSGDIPGGFALSQGDRLDAISIHPLIARRLIMGGPHAVSPFGVEHSLSISRPTQIGVGDAASYLNCTAQDISWLRARGHLESVGIPAARAMYDRACVEMLGGTYISTREIAARIGLKAKDVWEGFDLIAEETTIGQGFHLRAAIEPKLAQLAGSLFEG